MHLYDIPMKCLPVGLFERLVGRSIGWTLDTQVGINLDYMSLHKNSCGLFVGTQEFRITQNLDTNCIVVDVNGKSPIGVYERLKSMLTKLLSEYMKSLTCMTLLPFYAMC